MPPIPEDAVVIADYMLMADFVLQTTGTPGFISKGSRMQSGTRDVLYDGAVLTFNPNEQSFGPMAMSVYHGTASSTANLARIPAFATNAAVIGYDWPTRTRTYKQNGVTVSTTNTGGGYGSIMRPASSTTLGQNNFEYSGAGSASPHVHFWDIASPIHTSSHYQTFETPFLHELVGGDRNMEQTNLVVTPDGKTWDQVTRDVGYIGNVVLTQGINSGHISSSGTDIVWDEARGTSSNVPLVQKDWAIAYDMFICLKAGWYTFTCECQTRNHEAAWLDIKINRGNTISTINALTPSGGYGNLYSSKTIYMQRGESIRARGARMFGSSTASASFKIVRL
jgi:hypothetical protein